MNQEHEVCYDRAAALAQLDGDVSLFAAISGVFVAECEAYCSALEHARTAGTLEDLRREAHTAKSMLASFACESGRALALRLEQLAASGRSEGAAEMAAELVAAMRELAVALERDAA